MLAAFLPAAHVVVAAWFVMPGSAEQQFTSYLRAPTATRAGSSADTAWSALYRADLDTLRAFIAANHPGAVDPKNPEFARTLESAYEEAVGDTALVASYASYAIALARFGNRFQDAHLSIGATRPIGEIREAGIYPVYRSGGFVVARADTRYGSLAPALLGATVLGCGRQDAAQLFTSRVLSWRGRPAIEADWFRWAPLLLADYGPPTPPAPESCRFAIADRVIEIPLQWRSAPASEVRQTQFSLTSVAGRTLGVERHEGGLLWVNVPTFGVDGEERVAAMKAMLDSLRAALNATPKWSLLVVDLRGNDGGSSRWGDDIARIVYGERWLKQAHAWLSDGTYAEWRVSPFNLSAVDGIVKQLEGRHGAESDDAKRMRAFRTSMAEALERGDSLLGARQKRRGVKPPRATRLPGRVVLLTSASCFSACLDFLDRMRLHPAAIQVGQTTGVDTDYMENWAARLPSGLASISFPLKVYRNRRRAHNEAYVPKVAYEGAIENTEAIRAWISGSAKAW
jgi:hypothetical protein